MLSATDNYSNNIMLTPPPLKTFHFKPDKIINTPSKKFKTKKPIKRNSIQQIQQIQKSTLNREKCVQNLKMKNLKLKNRKILLDIKNARRETENLDLIKKKLEMEVTLLERQLIITTYHAE